MQEGSGTPYPAGGGKNLWGDLIQNTFVSQQGFSSGYSGAKTTGKIPCSEGDDYTLSCATSFAPAPGNIGVLAYFDASDTILTRVANTYQRAFTLKAPANAAYLRASCYKETDVDNVQLEKGSTATAYASYANIRPIHGRDSVTVERCGRNLLNPAKYEATTKTINGITFTRLDTGEVVVNGTATGTAIYVLIKNFPYQISLSTDRNWMIVSKNVISAQGLVSGVTLVRPSDNTGLYIRVASGTTVETTIQPQIEKSTTAPTTYTPYIGSTNTLTMPETVYGGEVDAVSGDGDENTKIITLDGTTNMFRLSGGFWNLPQNSSPGIRDGYDTNCSHFPPETFGGNKNKGYLFTKPQLLGKYFQDVNAFNAYLAAQYAAGTPVQVSYKLAEPVPFTATGAKPLPALVGVNTVLTDADSATVTGRADPIKRIEDLEAAVASIN